MWIELVAIGDEILSGDTINENAAYLAKRLKKAGYTVSQQTVLSDQPDRLKNGLEEALKRSDLIITTGGLGPTLDDLTKQTISRIFDKKLVTNPEVEKDLKERFGEDYPTISDQAKLPEGAGFFLNQIGTAPGVILEHHKKKLIMLPGVPYEMKNMFDQAIVWIEKHFPTEKKQFSSSINFCLLTEQEVDPVLRGMENETLSFGIYPGLALLRAVMHTHARSEAQANEVFSSAKKRLKAQFGDAMFFAENNLIEEAIHQKLTQDKKMLVLAESCSGGGLASRFTKLAGCSSYFLGSMVTYSNELKEKILHVSAETLEKKGAVSSETVEQMLKGLIETSTADYAVAISGIAGPTGGTTEKPVGTIYIGVQKRGDIPDIGRINVQSSATRDVIVEYASNYALSALWRKLSKNLRTFTK